MAEWKKYAAVFIFAAAWLCWLLIPVLAFLKLNAGQMAAATIILLVLSEILNYIGIVVVGKEIWDRIKSRVNLRKLLHKDAQKTADGNK